MCIYDVYGPCACPHGRCYTLLAQCFTIGSFITSLLAITSCFFVYVRPIPEEGQPEFPREGFGYISRQVGVLEPPNYRSCVWYTRDEKQEYFDAMWRTGKAFSMLATIVGCGVMCVVMCTCCVAYRLPTFDALFWVCIFCFVAQILTFLSWGSSLCDEFECTWSAGTGMNVTAAMLWIWAANMIKSFPEALPPRGRGGPKPPQYDDDGDEYYDDDYYDDGDEYDRYDDGYDDRYDDRNHAPRGGLGPGPGPGPSPGQQPSSYRRDDFDNGTYDDGTYEQGTYDDGTYENQTYDEGTYDEGTYDNNTNPRGGGRGYSSSDPYSQEDSYNNDPARQYDDGTGPNFVSTKDPNDRFEPTEFDPNASDNSNSFRNNNSTTDADFLGTDQDYTDPGQSYRNGYGNGSGMNDSYSSHRLD